MGHLVSTSNGSPFIAFIAGPYFGDGKQETIQNNIYQAEAIAIKCANEGIGFFCPHTHTAFFNFKTQAPGGEEFYRELAKHYLRQSHVMILLPSWDNSAGTLDEVKLARELLIPVFVGWELFHGWFTKHRWDRIRTSRVRPAI